MEENGTAPAAAETVETPKAEEAPVAAEAAETPVAAEVPVAAETAAVIAEVEAPAEPAAEPEEISYHAVEKDGHVAAIWEMQGRKHLRTIDPRSSEGKQIMELYTAETHE